MRRLIIKTRGLRGSRSLPSGHEVRLRSHVSALESQTGNIAAVAFWAVVFVVLSMLKGAIPGNVPPPEPEPIEIILDAPIPVPEDTTQPIEQMVEEAVATHAPLGDEAGEEIDPIFNVPSNSQATLESWTPTPEQAVALSDINLALQAASRDNDSRRVEVSKGIQDREMNLAGREFILNSDGGLKGVIRTLDVSGFEEAEVQRVLAQQYGITIETKRVKPQAGRNFLNAAKTADGLFTTAAEEGVYDVFLLSSKARSIMASMEITEMQNQGYDPTVTRIREIEFGMIRDEKTNQLRLAVTNLKLERIR